MNASHLSQSALLLTLLALVAEPCWAEEKRAAPPSVEQGEVKTKPRAQRTPPGKYAKEKAHDARTRAQEAKKSGKTLVAERLEQTAATWEKVAIHQEKAASLEADAAQIERKTLDIKSQARRAHSLVEQTETRRARAVARLRDLGLRDLGLRDLGLRDLGLRDLGPRDIGLSDAKKPAAEPKVDSQ